MRLQVAAGFRPPTDGLNRSVGRVL